MKMGVEEGEKKREILGGPAEVGTAEGGPAEGGPAEGGPAEGTEGGPIQGGGEEGVRWPKSAWLHQKRPKLAKLKVVAKVGLARPKSAQIGLVKGQSRPGSGQNRPGRGQSRPGQSGSVA